MSKRELKFWAANQKTGMTLRELRNALSQLPEEGNFYLRSGKAGLKGQIQALVFVEAEERSDETSAEA